MYIFIYKLLYIYILMTADKYLDIKCRQNLTLQKFSRPVPRAGKESSSPDWSAWGQQLSL